MSKFIPVKAEKPADVKHVNLDCVIASADYGDGQRTKLFMSDGQQIIIFMPYSDFVEMITSISSDE